MNGRKNSENVPSYDGNFMGHIRTDCEADILCQLRILKQDLFQKIYIFFLNSAKII